MLLVKFYVNIITHVHVGINMVHIDMDKLHVDMIVLNVYIIICHIDIRTTNKTVCFQEEKTFQIIADEEHVQRRFVLRIVFIVHVRK